MYITRGTLHQVLACTPVLFNQLLIGHGWGWTAPTLIRLRGPDSPFPITEQQASWVASVHEFGRMSSPLVSSLIVDSIGRKYSTLLVTLLFLLIWPSQIFICDFHLLCTVRILFGLTTGLHDVVASIYTTENCSTDLRSTMGSLTLNVFYVGFLFEAFTATYLEYRTANAVNSFISICALCSAYFCTETPHFSVMKRRYREAKNNLIWLRGNLGQTELSNALKNIENNVAEEREKRKSIKALFTSTDNLRSMCLVLGISLISSLTGSAAIGAYGGVVFPPSETMTPSDFNILYVACNFVTVCVSIFMVERFSRRSLLIWTHLVIGIGNCTLSTLFYLHDMNYEIALYPWLIFASVCVNGSMGALQSSSLYIIRGELLPLSVRAIGGSLAVIMSGLGSFTVFKMFLPVAACLGLRANFSIYSIMAFFTTVIIYYFLPETRGKSLEEIQEDMKGGVESSVDRQE